MASTSKLLREEFVLDILKESEEGVIVTAMLMVMIVKMTLQLLMPLLMKRTAKWSKKAKAILLV
jgi:hypothetical protein